MTPLTVINDAFFDLITDDMYLALSYEETKKDCRSLLMRSLPLFEFPEYAFQITEDEDGDPAILQDLTLEEINILAHGMVIVWIERQINSIELTRQKYTSNDFKMTSQAAHLSRLQSMLTAEKDEHRRLQMLHSRRDISEDGKYVSSLGRLVRKMS